MMWEQSVGIGEPHLIDWCELHMNGSGIVHIRYT